MVEKQPDPAAFKRMCSHFIQASGAPTIERLGLMEPIEEAGGVRSRIRAWTPWGWIEAAPEDAGLCVNLRRELLDPMVRETAAGMPGVEMLLGRTATAVLREGEAISGVTVRDRDGGEETLRCRLLVGADGRDSQIVKLAGVKEKTLPHDRFAYGSYFEGAQIDGAPDGRIWMTDPQWAAAFPTDGGLTFYAAMPTKDRLPEFKRDPEGALVSFIADLPEAPPILESRRVDDVIGKIEMPNRVRRTVAPGLALVGDAALATDPLFGVGCGWAFQSGEWLADSVGPALRGEEPLERGLKRYRRRHARELRGHAFMIHDYATGRRLRRKRTQALRRRRAPTPRWRRRSTRWPPGGSARRGCSPGRCRARWRSTSAASSGAGSERAAELLSGRREHERDAGPDSRAHPPARGRNRDPAGAGGALGVGRGGRLHPRQPGLRRRLGRARPRRRRGGDQGDRLRPAGLRRDRGAAGLRAHRARLRGFHRQGAGGARRSIASTSSSTTSAGRSGCSGRRRSRMRWPASP